MERIEAGPIAPEFTVRVGISQTIQRKSGRGDRGVVIYGSSGIRSPHAQEIGLRMAIGARPGDICRMILGEWLMLSLTGLALGLVGAWWLGRAGSSLLFGVTATDPLTFIAVSLLLTAVAAAACYFPARRAMKIEPIVALRQA